MVLAARGVCVLDAPEAEIEDPELAAALRAKGQRVTMTTALLTAVLTAAFYFVP